MEEIIIGVLGGGVVTAANWILLHTAALPWFRRSFRRTRKKSLKRAYKRLSGIFSSQFPRKTLVVFMLATLIPLAGTGIVLFPGSFAVWTGIGIYAASMVGLWAWAGRKQVEQFQINAATTALEIYREGQDVKAVLPFLLANAQHPDPVVRESSMEGLGLIGVAEGLPLLKKGKEDSDPNVSEAAERNYHQVLRLTGQEKVYGADIVEELIRYSDELRKKEYAFGSKRGYAYMEKRQRVEGVLKKVLHTHKHIRAQYPHLLCTHCLTRAALKTRSDWEYVRCRSCNSLNHLKGGIEKVVGYIGKDKEWDQQEGTLNLSLWSESDKKARFADIEKLIIVGGKDLNYDWAINAVLEVLKNGAVSADWKVPVIFEGKPELTRNTELLISKLNQQEITM